MQEINNNLQTETAVSAYDAVNAFLISFIIVVGSIVSIMFLLWLVSLDRQSVFQEVLPVPQNLTEAPVGFATDVHEPGIEEFPEVDSPPIAVKLESIAGAVSEVHNCTNDINGNVDTRQTGSPQTRTKSEDKRWEICYRATDIQDYSNQLCHFDIDIGIVSTSSNRVVRLQKPGGANKTILSDRQSEQGELYFVHQQRTLNRWDESLIQQNNLGGPDTFTVHFIPRSTRRLLRQLEAEYLNNAGKKLADVRKTTFQIKDVGNRFEFEVKSVSYH